MCTIYIYLPVTNIGMPTLDATSMVPDTVVPPLSFCIDNLMKWLMELMRIS